MLTLALDPARAGGGVLASQGTVIAAFHWHPHQQKRRQRFAVVFAVEGGAPLQRRGLRTPWEVGMVLREWLSPVVLTRGMGRALVAAEAAHLGRNARTGLALSRFGGALVGPLEGFDPSDVASWVEPDEWRKLSFRRGWWKLQAQADGKFASMRAATKHVLSTWDTEAHLGVGRAEIDKRMATAAKSLFLRKREAAKREAAQVLPGMVPGLAHLAAVVGGTEHVLDAAGIARWRWTQEDQ